MGELTVNERITVSSCHFDSVPQNTPCSWRPSPDDVACFVLSASTTKGQTENGDQVNALWKALPHILSRGVKRTPEKAFLETTGDGYYSPMISSLRFIFSDTSVHEIEWQIPHVHDIGNYPLKVLVNNEPVSITKQTKLSRLAHQLAGMTPMVVGALAYCCVESGE